MVCFFFLFIKTFNFFLKIFFIENQLNALAFEDFSELIHLEVRGNKLESLGHIPAPKLTRLYAAANQIKSFSGLENKPQLNVLHLRGNVFESLDGLSSDLKNLTYLNLRYVFNIIVVVYLSPYYEIYV